MMRTLSGTVTCLYSNVGLSAAPAPWRLPTSDSSPPRTKKVKKCTVSMWYQEKYR